MKIMIQDHNTQLQTYIVYLKWQLNVCPSLRTSIHKTVCCD